MTYFEDLTSATIVKRWLIKGIMARGESRHGLQPLEG